MLRIRPIESEVEVTNEEVEVSDGVRLNHIPLAEETDLLQDPLRHLQSLVNRVLAGLKMAVDEAKRHIIESELDHDSTFPPIPDHVLHDVVLGGVSHESAVLLLDENDDEDLAFPKELNHVILPAQVALDQVDLFFFLITALLAAEDYYVVLLIVWEHGFKVDRLRLTSVVPGDDQDI